MSNAYPQSGISPAMLASYQQQQQQRGGGSVNPSQLMGGAGAGGIKPPSMGNMQMGSINPAQLLAQQNNQNNFMNGMNGMGGGGSINPSALTGGGGSPSIPSHTPSGIPSSPSLSSAPHPGMAGMAGMNIGNMAMGGGMGMNASMNASMGLGHQNPNPQNPSGSHPHQQPQPQLSSQQQHFLNTLGMTHQQFGALSPQEKQAKMVQYQQHQKEQMLLRQQQLMQNQNQGGSSNMGGMGNMGGGGGGGMGGMGMQQQQQQHHGMQQPGFGGQQSSMQHGSQGFNAQLMNNMSNMGMNNMAGMGGMNSMFSQNQPSSQQAMNQQAHGDMLGRTGSAMGMHPNPSTGEFFNRPGSSMGMNPMMNNSMMNNLSSGMGGMGGGMSNVPGMAQNMGGLSNNLGNMSMSMNLGGAGGMGGSSMPGMGGMSGHQQQHPSQGHQQQQHPSHGAPGQPGQGPQGSMGPPSGIPRGPGGMGGPGGMSISTGMRNISGTHTPGPPGSARPPSRAMSGTPVSANISARGMSPSTPISAQPGQQPLQPGQNPYPPSTPASQGNQGQQQGQRRTPTPAARPGSANGPRPQSSQSQHHSPVVPPQSPSTRGPSVGPPNVNLSQGIKRKAEDAPIGSPTTATATSISAGPAMGPPNLPRTHSSSSGMVDMMNGMVPQRPGSSIGMNGMTGMQHPPSAPGQPGMGQGIQGGMPAQGMQPGAQGQRQGSVPLRQGSVPLAGGNMPHTPMMGPTGMPGSAVKAGSVPPDMNMSMGTPSAGPVAPPPTATAAAAAVAPTASTGTLAAPAQPAVNYSLPPLPANVSLNPAVTRVSVVPLATSLTSIPALSENEIDDIKGWMEKDKEYETVWRGMKDKMNREIRVVLNGGTYEQQLQFDRAFDPKKEGDKEGDEEKVPTRTYNGAGVGGGWVGWWEKGGNLFDGSGMKAAVEGNQVQGYGNMNRWRRPREPFDVRYPRHRKEPGRGRRNKREGLKLPRKLDPEEVNKPEMLVPVRLEFDVEHHRMRDTFIWNLNDPVVTPEHFAQTVVEDYGLAPSYHSIIVKSIQDQLSDYKAHSGMFDPDGTEQQIASSPVVPAPAAPKHENEDKENEGAIGLINGVAKAEPASRTELRGVLDDENGQWWREWRTTVEKLAAPATKKRSKKRRKVVIKDEDMDADIEDGAEDAEGDSEVNKGMKLNEFEIKEELFHEDMRILIKLDIIVGSMKLDDQFEWDLDNENASPEDFAEVYCQDLGLNGEFKTAIAHLIREQIQTYQKSLFLVGHPSDGSPIQDDDLRSSFLPGLTSAARPSDQVQQFTPLLNYLSDGEIERNEKERDKDMTKRRKRNTRGRRGIALPDREPIRTYRTPAIGFPELDPATLALAAAANAPVSRRAAAAAASLTIASMVASENGEKFTPTLPAATITPSAPAAKKEKAVKGLFKAPPLPSSVLGARAQVTGPIASTAADVASLPAPLENDPLPLVPSISITSAPEGSRFSKLMNARRVKELEREAKEKEFVDGQHPNMINGVWHCSNCGCPENIAIGRRKGPLGDKSQCGTCGKYWHRHRRPRPVEYNPDPDYHSGIKRDAENATKSAAAKKKGAAALRAQNSTSTPAESAPPTPSRTNGDVEMSSRQSPAPGLLDDDDRPISPVSTASDASETPLVQRIKSNGHTRASTPPVGTPGSKAAPGTPTPAPRPKAEAKDDEKKSTDGILSSPTNSAKPIPGQPPLWLIKAKEGMMARYPHDRFETILRKVNAGSSAEWRIKCLDCPGKLYTPGPGETLSNYEVHLKNRQHRQRVNDRLQATGEEP